MAYLATFAYDIRIEAKPPLQVPNELAEMGFYELTAFHNGLQDGWAYIAQSKDLIVLSFRGTRSVRDWDTAFQVALVNPAGTDAKLRVHEGFYGAFAALNDGVLGLKRKIDEIKIATNGKTAIYITGHSLGGALAQIASAVFGDDQIAACYTFGSPRVGNAYFDLWVKPPSYRVMNYADIVPLLPLPLIYRHSGDPRYMPDVVKGSPYRFEPNPLERLWQFCRGVVQFLKAGSILGIQDHRMSEYCRKLDDIARARSQCR